ncbi:3,4-dihydroxy-2-butanone 4-phosphate synthase [Aulographum hederae CBS 113979]|uniref:3,4-dihydroxy-2-butanone 4-phosphate synthase n=1 Tax=Aulographum hederae CBS 113979 TaxID=1176131 RepID=A0A6G1GTK2_9PEZI|nr:3,4-dihydroxy-2-butanone 4-phosphate synthase [Aulographum hederae CBS 113979]
MPAPTASETAPAANGTNVNANGSAVVEAKKVSPPAFDSIEDTIESFKNGNFVLVLDSASRENEGDLIIACTHLNTQKMAFMIHHTSGYICVPLTPSLCTRLELPQMVDLEKSGDPNRTAYTVTVDAREGTSTGISAEDRARTCRLLADPGSRAEDFRRPGHIVPLRAREGGIRARFGHTEAAVELCRLAGLPQVGAICEMVKPGMEVEGVAEREESGMARRDDCLEFGRRWGIRVCTIEDLVEWVEAREGKLGERGVDY